MADAYDQYRLAPQTYQNPWALQGDPQQFYGPSASVWGNIGKGAVAGAGIGAAFGGVGAVPGAVIGAAVNPFRQSFQSLGDLRSGDSWKNLMSGGANFKKDEQNKALMQRMMAVSQWQIEQKRRLGERLSQQGADVRGDLEGELNTAIDASGKMGDMDATKDAMTKFEQRYQQYMLGRQRAGQARQVDAMMTDQGRLAARKNRLDAERKQGLGGIAEQYRIGQRDNAFNQARRGMQGGSTDVEKQGELGRGRDRAAMGLQQGLNAKAQQYRLGDQQQRSALMGLIYADDPNTAAAYQTTLDSIENQGRMVQENQALNSQMSAQKSAAATGYSQALGGLMSAGSKPLGYYVEHSGGGA
jgi:hypothetical protein